MDLDGSELDVAQCELVRGDERQHLTTKEVEVLTYLADHPSRNVSYEELLEEVWGHSRLASTQPVYSTIKRLRRKVDASGAHKHIVTVHGVGYRFEPPRRAAPVEVSRPASARPSAVSLSSFVGRAGDLARVEGALERGARIVSIVGPGGAGKTRLALEVSSRAAARDREVVLSELSALASGDDVTPAIAAALGARASADDPRGQRAIGRASRARGVWALLLDNAEHVLDAVARAASELASIVPILVTSRERLGVPGEHVVELGPLEEEDGVLLLEERLRATGLSLESPTRARSLVARLDGLPLAIEIAAAHAGLVSLEHVEAALDGQLDQLQVTRRGVPDRHATLRSSVEWSWSLLEPEARAVLAGCVVFVGGFTPEAAEAVLATHGVRTQLMRLRERSLLRAPRGTSGRLALYACVRELAAGKLVDRADAEERHARWALACVRASGALEDVPPPTAYAALAPELENLRAAFRHAQAADPARACELALAIDLVETPTRGPGAAPELASAIDVATGEQAVRVRLARGRAQEHAGREGLRFLEETRALSRSHGTPLHVLEADRQWATSLATLGEPGAALAPLEDALSHALSLAPRSALAGRIALDLAEAQLAAGSVARARELALEAMRTLEAAGDPTHAARAASVLAHVHREQAEPEQSLAALERARRWLEDAGDEVALARLAIDRGVLLAHLARTEEALEPLEEAIAAHRRLGLVTGELRARDWMVLALLGLGRDDDALAQAREMQQLALDLGRPSYEAERAFGATWLVTGKLDEADAALGRALELLAHGGKAAVRGHVLSVRALGRVLASRLVEAEADLVACVAVHDERGSEAAEHHSRAELALVRELSSPRTDTAAIVAEAEPVGGAPWEHRHARGRRAMLAILRARRDGQGEEARSLAARARVELLEGRARVIDYFTRCTLLLLDHIARHDASA